MIASRLGDQSGRYASKEGLFHHPGALVLWPRQRVSPIFACLSYIPADCIQTISLLSRIFCFFLAQIKRSVLGRFPARKETPERRVNRSSPALIPARLRHPTLGTATAMASSTPQKAQCAAKDQAQAQAQLQLPLRLTTPGGGCMDGASSHAVTPTTQDSWRFATSAGGSKDVFSSLSGLRGGQKPSSAAAAAAAAAFSRGSVWSPPCLETLPSEVLAHIAGFLDVDDLLRASRVSMMPKTVPC